MTEQAMAKEPCQHHWLSQHKPGHIVYWVRVCAICHEPDWDDLDKQIREAKWLTSVTAAQILWGNEMYREASAVDPPIFSQMPPSAPVGLWQVTGFDLKNNGSLLILWWAAIPAVPAHQGG